MILLGIDTSCDDTSVAVLHNDRVLSNIISSQDDIHRDWGGVVPNLARRAHEENFQKVYELALKRAGIAEDQIEAIAVTYGPGLAIALGVGIDKAKELAARLSIPLYAVNHMEGHLFSPLAKSKNDRGTSWQILPFPLIGLLTSGKHTEIVLVKNFGEYEVLGQTLDDALGEAFDKVARMVGLGYPGGSLLAKLALEGNPHAYKLPIPMKGTPDFNVSYSGLKTATRRLLHEMTHGQPETLTKAQILDVAAVFQDAALETILWKLGKALEKYPVKHVLLGGGSAANVTLRKRLRTLAKKHGAQVFTPRNKKLCSDNGAMIALAAYLGIRHGKQPSDPDCVERAPQLSL